MTCPIPILLNGEEKLFWCRVPLIAYRRQNNIKDNIIRAKVSPVIKNNLGMKKCGKQCPICPYIEEGKLIKCDNFTWKITKQYTCYSQNLIYLILCNKEKCNKKYIGQTERKLKDRICEHIGYIKSKKLNEATGAHFNLPGHSVANMSVTVIEKSKKQDNNYREERETYLIRKCNTFYNGINKSP